MNRYLPKMYQKDIFSISYDLLKKKGIKFLVFDLDNTLALIEEKYPKKEIVLHLNSLKQDFGIAIISNSFPHRVKPFGDIFGVSVYPLAMKPCVFSIKKLMRQNKVKKEEIAIIGDQFMTDMRLGARMGIYTILVDPLSIKEFKITSINRYRENKLLEQYKKDGVFLKGKYYDE